MIEASRSGFAEMRLPCVYCGHDAMTRFGIDKRGRPFTHCAYCGARAFLPSRACLDAFGIIAPALVDVLRMVRGNDSLRLRAEQTQQALVAQLDRPAVNAG